MNFHMIPKINYSATEERIDNTGSTFVTQQDSAKNANISFKELSSKKTAVNGGYSETTLKNLLESLGVVDAIEFSKH